jgi:hypothetical protein
MELPEHWTPAQALAVFELIELLRDQLWAAYGSQIQRALRDDQQGNESREPHVPLDPDRPF